MEAWLTDAPAPAEAPLGIVLQGPVSTLAAAAARSEAAGVRSVWLGEYFQAALVRAAVVLGATERVLVGTHVLQAFGRSPLVTALAARELSELGDGRFVLGLGSQLPAANRHWHAFETEQPITDLGEYVHAVRTLLAGEGQPVELPGPRWPLQVPEAGWPGAPAVPIGVGCARLGSVGLAARAGDLVLGHLLWSPGFVAAVRDRLAAAGRPDLPVTAARLIAPASVAGARLDAAKALAHYAVTGAYATLLEGAGITLARTELLQALRTSDDVVVARLAGPLLAAFGIEDAEGLSRHRRALSAAGVSEVVLVAPARRTEPAATERYERAALTMIAAAS